MKCNFFVITDGVDEPKLVAAVDTVDAALAAAESYTEQFLVNTVITNRVGAAELYVETDIDCKSSPCPCAPAEEDVANRAWELLQAMMGGGCPGGVCKLEDDNLDAFEYETEDTDAV